MNDGSVGRSAVARLRRAGAAIRDFLGPLDSADAVGPTRSPQRAVPPFCVFYGRAVFCMYAPEPRALQRPLAEADAASSAEPGRAASAGPSR